MTAAAPALVDDLPVLLELLQRQRSLYRQLRELSGRQGPLVTQGLAEPLLSLLAQRQRLIDELAAVNERLEPFRRDWPRLWVSLPDDDQERVAGLVKETQELLASILTQDERDREVLQSARGQILQEIDKMSRSSHAVSAYQTAPAAGYAKAGAAANNRFTDRQG